MTKEVLYKIEKLLEETTVDKSKHIKIVGPDNNLLGNLEKRYSNNSRRHHYYLTDLKINSPEDARYVAKAIEQARKEATDLFMPNKLYDAYFKGPKPLVKSRYLERDPMFLNSGYEGEKRLGLNRDDLIEAEREMQKNKYPIWNAIDNALKKIRI
jgi:hypothetical protein